jgi:O-antigen/teichoic acid export membrane protein
MSPRQSIGRNAFFLSAEPVFFGVISIVVAGYVARMIGVEQYGKLAFALAFINFFTLFTNFGFNNYLMKEFAADPERAEAQFLPILIIRSVLALLTYGVGVAAINLLGYPEETKVIFYAAGVIVLPLYLGDSNQGVFKGRERMQYIAMMGMVHSLLLHTLRVVVVYLGYQALALAWTRVVCASFIAIVGLYYVYKHFLRPRISFQWTLYKQILLGTLPFAFSMSFLIIYNRIDIIMLSYMTGDETAGYYKVAHVLTERLSIITVAIVGAIYPAVSRLFIQDRPRAVELYHRTFLYLFLLAAPIAIGGILLSGKIIALIFGDQYLPATPVLQFLFAAIPLIYANSVMGNILMAINQARLFSIVMTILSATSIIGNLILIPRYAHTGAAAATLIAQVINFVLLAYLTRKTFGGLAIDAKLLKVAVSGGVMGLAVWAFGSWHLLPTVLAGAGIYLLSIWMLQTIHRDELLEIRAMILRPKK